MKIKNHYVWICGLWIFATVVQSLACLVNFVGDNLIAGFIFLVTSVAFAFVSGILFNKAVIIHKHNKTCDFLMDIHEFLREHQVEEKPFEEFENKEG